MTQKLSIEGGLSLHGETIIAGAKNAALPMLCAALLTDEDVVLHNVPQLNDVATLLKLLTELGVVVERTGDSVRLSAAQITSTTAPYESVKTMRASILLLGPLLARFHHTKISLPGGCAIGSRPVDQHIKGMVALGASVEIVDGYINAHTTGLRGTHLYTDMVTVTGTENLLMAAVLAEGETIIENAAKEPEVSNLIQMLIAMGARIEGIGSNRLIIQGVKKLHGVNNIAILPDRIEAGTFMCAVAACGGEVSLKNPYFNPNETILPWGKDWFNIFDAVSHKLSEAGATVRHDGEYCHIQRKLHVRPKAVGFRTDVYPAFPTDMQAQLMAVNCIAEGSAVMVETIFENRFMHIDELRRLGAHIVVHGNTATSEGVTKLTAAPVMATDLRASASLVIGALIAEGTTTIDRIYHLDRGYAGLEKKLSQLGAKVTRLAN